MKPPMERFQWRSDQLFLTSMLLGVGSHIMYFLSTGRNAWHETWSKRYQGSASLHFTLVEAKKTAEKGRTQGTVFTIDQVPALAFRCRTGIAYCTETHSQESFKMLNWSDPMHFLKIGAAMPDVINVFSKPDPVAWGIPRPRQDSFVTRVFDLAGNVDPTNGKTSRIEVEPLDTKSKLNRWKSYPNGPGGMGWNLAESDRDLTSIGKVLERFNSLNSPQLKLAANGLFFAAENFLRCHAEENWKPPDLELQATLREVALEFPNLFPRPDGK